MEQLVESELCGYLIIFNHVIWKWKNCDIILLIPGPIVQTTFNALLFKRSNNHHTSFDCECVWKQLAVFYAFVLQKFAGIN